MSALSSSPQPRRGGTFVAVTSWLAASIALTLSNRWILHGLGFNFPLFLTVLHAGGNAVVMLFACEVCGLFESPFRRCDVASLARTFAPISLLFACSTVLRNSAYAHLSVASIQIINSASPAIVYVLACVVGLEAFNPLTGVSLAFIVAGVTLATCTMAQASSYGLTVQSSGVVVECFRGVLLKTLFVRLNKEVTMNQLLALMLPMTFAWLALPVAATSILPPLRAIAESEGGVLPASLAVNVLLALALNMCSLHFISTCRVTTTSVSAIARDCALVLGSIIASPATARPATLIGYLLSMLATCAYVGIKALGPGDAHRDRNPDKLLHRLTDKNGARDKAAGARERREEAA